MLKMRVLVSACAAVLTSIVACTPATEADTLEGDYGLAEFNGEVLPVLYRQTLDGDCNIELSRGSLVLHPGGTFEFEVVWTNSCTGNAVQRGNVSGEYERTQDDLLVLTQVSRYDQEDPLTYEARLGDATITVIADDTERYLFIKL